jgi:Fungal N-terminal domain of STAND proteins
MAGIGEAASVIAVIQITTQVVKLCGGYLSEVNDARQDIERLRSKALALQGVLERAQRIVEDSKFDRLPVLNSVLESLRQCVSDLQLLQTKLDLGKRGKIMKSFGLRALKWPFTKMEFEKTVEMLDGYTTTFNTALVVDHL